MNKKQFKTELLKNNIPLSRLNAKIVLNPKSINDIPLNEWIIINQSRIGIVYVFRTLKGVFIEFFRVYSSDYSFYTNDYFNNWRNSINE